MIIRSRFVEIATGGERAGQVRPEAIIAKINQQHWFG